MLSTTLNRSSRLGIPNPRRHPNLMHHSLNHHQHLTSYLGKCCLHADASLIYALPSGVKVPKISSCTIKLYFISNICHPLLLYSSILVELTFPEGINEVSIHPFIHSSTILSTSARLYCTSTVCDTVR